MSDTDTIKVSGLREVQKSLYSYSQELGDKVILTSLRSGARIILKDVRRTAPVYKGPPRKGVISGVLKKGFKIKDSKIYSKKRSGSTIGVYLTLKAPKKGRVGGGDDPFYGRWQEDGWTTRGKSKGMIRKIFRSRSGRKSQPGKTKVPGKHFVKKALDRNRENFLRVVSQNLFSASEMIKKKVGLS